MPAVVPDVAIQRGLSVSLYVCLLHSCTYPVNPLDTMRCHATETLVWFHVTVLQRGGGPVFSRERQIWGSKAPVRICIAGCGDGAHCQITSTLVIVCISRPV